MNLKIEALEVISIEKKENFYQLAEKLKLSGPKLRKEFLNTFEKATYAEPPKGWEHAARGCFIDDETGATLIVKHLDEYELL